MPRPAPGERRGGGRPKGSQNKSKIAENLGIAEALKVAFANLGPEAIDGLTPAEMIRFASREAAKSGFPQAACALAKDAAPYFCRRADQDEGDGPERSVTVVVTGGLPG